VQQGARPGVPGPGRAGPATAQHVIVVRPGAAAAAPGTGRHSTVAGMCVAACQLARLVGRLPHAPRAPPPTPRRRRRCRRALTRRRRPPPRRQPNNQVVVVQHEGAVPVAVANQYP
jgi:hypothetical protein